MISFSFIVTKVYDFTFTEILRVIVSLFFAVIFAANLFGFTLLCLYLTAFLVLIQLTDRVVHHIETCNRILT